MSELPRCKLCGAPAAIRLGESVGCATINCPVRDMPYVAEDQWLLLMSDTLPDWARVRETAKEPPPTKPIVPVMAYNRPQGYWSSYGSEMVATNSDIYTNWHYPPPTPVPKEPSKFEKFRAMHPWPKEKFYEDLHKATWNDACDVLGQPEEKV